MCWAHLCHDKGEFNGICDELALIPTISSHGILFFDFQPTSHQTTGVFLQPIAHFIQLVLKAVSREPYSMSKTPLK